MAHPTKSHGFQITERDGRKCIVVLRHAGRKVEPVAGLAFHGPEISADYDLGELGEALCAALDGLHRIAPAPAPTPAPTPAVRRMPTLGDPGSGQDDDD